MQNRHREGNYQSKVRCIDYDTWVELWYMWLHKKNISKKSSSEKTYSTCMSEWGSDDPFRTESLYFIVPNLSLALEFWRLVELLILFSHTVLWIATLSNPSNLSTYHLSAEGEHIFFPRKALKGVFKKMESESFCNDCQGKRQNIVEIVQTAKKIKNKTYMYYVDEGYLCL